MNKRYPTLAGLALGVILTGGCAAEAAAPPPAPPAAPAASQGVVSNGAATQSGAQATTRTPPAAAAMVCSPEAKDNVTKILGLVQAPRTTPAWKGTEYSCVYNLPDGNFTMSVEVFPKTPAATAGAQDLAASLNAQPIPGLSNLGLPGYQSAAGIVVFAKDNMVLRVDATTMSPTVGINHVPRTDFAYQMATTILACWSEH